MVGGLAGGMVSQTFVGAFALDKLDLEQASQDLAWNCRVLKFEPEPEHDSPPVITDVAVQRDGELLAIVGDDHLVRLCSKKTGELIKKLHGHEDWVRCAQFSPDGTRLISAGNDRNVLEWNLTNGQLLRRFARQSDAVVAVAFDRTGDRLATAGFQNRVLVYNMADGQVIHDLECPDADMRSVAFSSDGQYLAAGGRSGTVRVWEAASGQMIRDLVIHRRRIHRVLFADHGETLISCADDRLVKLTPVNGGESIALPRRPCKVQTVTMVGPNLIASAGSDNLIRLWDRSTYEEIGKLVGHRGTVTTLAFDGEALYSGSYDTEVRIWTVNSETAKRWRTVPEIGQRPRGSSIQ